MRVVGDILAYNNRIYFTAFYYNPDDNLPDACVMNPGRSYLYEINAFSGRPMYDYCTETNCDDRVIASLGNGLASQPVLAVDQNNDAKIYVTKGDGGLAVVDTEDALLTTQTKILWWKVL